jgi:hypothetical protein
MIDTYHLVYDLATDGPASRWIAYISAGAALACLACIALYRKLPSIQTNLGRMPAGAFGGLWFGVVAVISGMMFLSSFSSYRDLRRAMRDGKEQSVEGVVARMRASGIENHKTTTLEVGGLTFNWSESSADHNGYRVMPSAEGAPLEGKCVRIRYVDEGWRSITRVEVAD